MKHQVADIKTACDWWRRPDLQSKPENMERVAEVLQEAEIEVYSVTSSTDGWLVCEPRPDAIYEALSGKLSNRKRTTFPNFPYNPLHGPEALETKGRIS